MSRLREDEVAEKLEWSRRIVAIMDDEKIGSVYERAREVTLMLRRAETTGHLCLSCHESHQLTCIEVHVVNEMRAENGDSSYIESLVLRFQVMLLKGECDDGAQDGGDDAARNRALEERKKTLASTADVKRFKEQLAATERLTPARIKKLLRLFVARLSPGFYGELLARAQSVRNVPKDLFYNGVLTALACESLMWPLPE